MTLVVDASVAIKWFFEETGYAAARAILDEHDALAAPSIILAEVTNAAWKRFRRHEITRADANSVVQLMATPFSMIVPIEQLTAEAAEMSFDLHHPVYDCFYLALAARRDARFVTADKSLAALADRIGLQVELLRSMQR